MALFGFDTAIDTLMGRVQEAYAQQQAEGFDPGGYLSQQEADDLASQGWVWDAASGRYLPPTGYAGGEKGFYDLLTNIRAKYAPPDPQSALEQVEVANQAPFSATGPLPVFETPEPESIRGVQGQIFPPSVGEGTANTVFGLQSPASLLPAAQEAFSSPTLTGQNAAIALTPPQIYAGQQARAGGGIMSKLLPGIDLAGDIAKTGLDVLRQNTIYTTNTVGGQGAFGQTPVVTQQRPIQDTITPIPAVERFQEGVESQLEQVPGVGPALGVASELLIPTSPLEIGLAPTGLGTVGDVTDAAKLLRWAAQAGVINPAGAVVKSPALARAAQKFGMSADGLVDTIKRLHTEELGASRGGNPLDPRSLGGGQADDLAGIEREIESINDWLRNNATTTKTGTTTRAAQTRYNRLQELEAAAQPLRDAQRAQELVARYNQEPGQLERHIASLRDEVAMGRSRPDLIDATRTAAKERELALLESASPSPPTGSMTPEAVSAIRRRQKGGTEIPVSQDPMAPTARRGGRRAAGTTPPPEPPASVAVAEPPMRPPEPPTGTGSGGEDFAGNIRLSKYPEDIRDTIKGWADANPDVVEGARRGTISNEQTEQMARDLVNDLGGDFAKTQRAWKAGQAWNAEEITAIRGALNDATRKVMDAAENARLVDSTENQVKLTEAILEQQRIQQIVHGVTAEAGRSLQIFRRNAAEALADGDVARMQEIMRRALNAGKNEDIAALTDAIRALDVTDPVAVNNFLRKVNKPDFWDKLHFYWMNSILSGPITQTRNIVGNVGTALYSPVQRVGAAAIEQPLARIQGRQAQRFWQEAPASVVGVFQGLPEGVRGALTTLKTGISPRAAEKLEIRPQPIGGGIGAVIGMPTRALGAADEFFSAINYRSSLNANAVRMARSEGLKGDALTNRIAELVHNPPRSLMNKATAEAEELVFRGDPGEVAKAIAYLRQKVPGGRYIVPFLNTPANLLKYGVKNSPLGLLDFNSWRKAMAGNPEGADELARGVLGSLVAASVASGVATGVLDITAAAPIDSAERDRFYREGKMPFSIKIPGAGWVEYKQIPGLDTTLTLVASAVDGIRNGEDVTGIASQAGANIATNLLDKSYMSGLSDLFDAVQDPMRYAERYVTRHLSGYVPFSGLQRQSTGFVDRTLRDPEGLSEQIQSQIPGLSENVPPRLDAFGQEIRRGLPSPVLVSPDRQSEVDAELERLGVEVTFVGDSIGGVKLNREEQALYQRMAGGLTYALLDTVTRDERYRGQEDVVRQKVVDDLKGDARDAAREVLAAILKDPEYQTLSGDEKAELQRRLLEKWRAKLEERGLVAGAR